MAAILDIRFRKIKNQIPYSQKYMIWHQDDSNNYDNNYLEFYSKMYILILKMAALLKNCGNLDILIG